MPAANGRWSIRVAATPIIGTRPNEGGKRQRSGRLRQPLTAEALDNADDESEGSEQAHIIRRDSTGADSLTNPAGTSREKWLNLIAAISLIALIFLCLAWELLARAAAPGRLLAGAEGPAAAGAAVRHPARPSLHAPVGLDADPDLLDRRNRPRHDGQRHRLGTGRRGNVAGIDILRRRGCLCPTDAAGLAGRSSRQSCGFTRSGS